MIPAARAFQFADHFLPGEHAICDVLQLSTVHAIDRMICRQRILQLRGFGAEDRVQFRFRGLGELRVATGRIDDQRSAAFDEFLDRRLCRIGETKLADTRQMRDG